MAASISCCHKQGHLCSCLTILFFLLGLARIGHTATAQRYAYRTVHVPFTDSVGWTQITGITDKGKLSGTYLDANARTCSWTSIGATTSFQQLTYPKKTLIVEDINAWKRTFGYYFDRRGYQGFTLHSGHLYTLRIPGAVAVYGCGDNDTHLMVCTFIDALCDGDTIIREINNSRLMAATCQDRSEEGSVTG